MKYLILIILSIPSVVFSYVQTACVDPDYTNDNDHVITSITSAYNAKVGDLIIQTWSTELVKPAFKVTKIAGYLASCGTTLGEGYIRTPIYSVKQVNCPTGSNHFMQLGAHWGNHPDLTPLSCPEGQYQGYFSQLCLEQVSQAAGTCPPIPDPPVEAVTPVQYSQIVSFLLGGLSSGAFALATLRLTRSST